MTATITEPKVIMISGANRGIGKQIADRLLATDQYHLSLGVRNPSTLLEDPLGRSPKVLISPYEAKERHAGSRWVQQTVAQWGRIDGLINCAGLLKAIPFDSEDEAEFDELFEVNLKAPWRLSRAAFPYLKQCGDGRVINLVSMSGKRVKGQLAGYSISKFALLALSQTMRNVGWEDGVRVTSLCPSWVNTDMAAGINVMPAEKMTQPEDIAELVLTLLQLPNTAAVGEVLINCNLET